MKPSQRSKFITLPIEILSVIAIFLDAKQLGNLRLVCKLFDRIIRPILWRNVVIIFPGVRYLPTCQCQHECACYKGIMEFSYDPNRFYDKQLFLLLNAYRLSLHTLFSDNKPAYCCYLKNSFGAGSKRIRHTKPAIPWHFIKSIMVWRSTEEERLRPAPPEASLDIKNVLNRFREHINRINRFKTMASIIKNSERYYESATYTNRIARKEWVNACSIHRYSEYFFKFMNELRREEHHLYSVFERSEDGQLVSRAAPSRTPCLVSEGCPETQRLEYTFVRGGYLFPLTLIEAACVAIDHLTILRIVLHGGYRMEYQFKIHPRRTIQLKRLEIVGWIAQSFIPMGHVDLEWTQFFSAQYLKLDHLKNPLDSISESVRDEVVELDIRCPNQPAECRSLWPKLTSLRLCDVSLSRIRKFKIGSANAAHIEMLYVDCARLPVLEVLAERFFHCETIWIGRVDIDSRLEYVPWVCSGERANRANRFSSFTGSIDTVSTGSTISAASIDITGSANAYRGRAQHSIMSRVSVEHLSISSGLLNKLGFILQEFCTVNVISLSIQHHNSTAYGVASSTSTPILVGSRGSNTESNVAEGLLKEIGFKIEWVYARISDRIQLLINLRQTARKFVHAVDSNVCPPLEALHFVYGDKYIVLSFSDAVKLASNKLEVVKARNRFKK